MLSLDPEETDYRREFRQQLVLALDVFSDALIRNLERFTGDSSSVETIWTCCITCLAHLAALCHFVSQEEPALSGSMDDLCDLTLDKLGGLSRGMYIEDFSYFDVLTGVRALIVLLRVSGALIKNDNQSSWKRALDTIDARIELCPPAKSESLRYLRGVIGTVYHDFQVKLLGHEPTLFVALALSVDGRTSDSNFPNLLLHTERERCGL